MEYSQSFTIRQHVKLLPKHCFRCPPCVEQENTYSIYAGLTKDSEAEILRADEVSVNKHSGIMFIQRFHSIKFVAYESQLSNFLFFIEICFH